MPILPAEKQNIKNVTINMEATLSEDISTVALYQNKEAHKIENGKAIAKIIADEFGLKQKGKIYIEDNNVFFEFEAPTGEKYILTYFLSDSTWTFTNLSYTGEEVIPPTTMPRQKQLFEKCLLGNALINKDAKYTLQDINCLRWEVTTPSSLKDYKQNFDAGMIMITPSQTNIPNSMYYFITKNTYFKNVDIISQKQAFEEIKNGNFSIYPNLNKDDIVNIKSVDISYIYDTKGYYQPVYDFKAQINNDDNLISIQIPAMQS